MLLFSLKDWTSTVIYFNKKILLVICVFIYVYNGTHELYTVYWCISLVMIDSMKMLLNVKFHPRIIFKYTQLHLQFEFEVIITKLICIRDGNI